MSDRMSVKGPQRTVDGAPDAMLTVDRDQHIVDLNPAAETMFGVERDAVMGQDMVELFIPPETREIQREAFARAINGGDPQFLGTGVTAHFEAMRPDGSRFPLALTLNITKADPLEVTAWMHDRTKEVLIEHQTTLSERVEAAVGAGSWEWDTTNDVVTWSDGLLRLFGYEPGETEPTVDMMLEHVHPDDLEFVKSRIATMIEEGFVEPYEYRIFTRDDELVHIRITVARSESSEGGQVLAGSVMDVTEQRQMARRAAFLGAVVDWTVEAADLPLRNDAIDLLLARMGSAVNGLAASFWVPKGGVLRCLTTWSAGLVDAAALDDACGQAELPPGAGLPGRAWQREEPTYLKSGDANDHVRAKAMAAADLRGGAAIPAMSAGNMLAVVELLFRESRDATPDGMATARAGGVLIGEFLSRRRGELETTTLTKRELEILQHAAEGLSGPKIAEHLVISPATVKSHFEHIYPKLKVADRPAAVAEALRLGLIR